MGSFSIGKVVVKKERLNLFQIRTLKYKACINQRALIASGITTHCFSLNYSH